MTTMNRPPYGDPSNEAAYYTRDRKALPWGGSDPCGDCGTPPGQLHAKHCDQAECQRCGGQRVVNDHDGPGGQCDTRLAAKTAQADRAARKAAWLARPT